MSIWSESVVPITAAAATRHTLESLLAVKGGQTTCDPLSFHLVLKRGLLRMGVPSLVTLGHSQAEQWPNFGNSYHANLYEALVGVSQDPI